MSSRSPDPIRGILEAIREDLRELRADLHPLARARILERLDRLERRDEEIRVTSAERERWIYRLVLGALITAFVSGLVVVGLGLVT